MTPGPEVFVAPCWAELSPMLARVWDAGDVEQFVQAVADAALSVAGGTGSRFCLQRPGGLVEVAAAAGSWPPGPQRRTSWATRHGARGTTIDRQVLDAHGSVVGTVSVRTESLVRRPVADQIATLLEALVVQVGHALDQRGTVERLGRAQSALVAAQSRTRRLEAAWHAAFDQAPTGMALLSLTGDGVGDLVRVNDALCRITGRTATALTATSMLRLTEPSDYGPLASALARAAAGRRTPSTLVVRLHRAEEDDAPSTVQVRVTTCPIVDDDDTAMHAVIHIEDLTARAHPRDEPGTQRDPVTGLLSRASFTAAVDGTRHRAVRAAANTAVLLCDLNLIDPRTAALSPEVAATLRAELAAQVQGALRPDDAVGQVDPTTIGVVLAELSTADAEAVAARVFQAVTRTIAGHLPDPAGGAGGTDLAPTDRARNRGCGEIAIAMMAPGPDRDPDLKAILDRALTTLRVGDPASTSGRTRAAYRPEGPGTKIILWRRGDDATARPHQSTRVTLWQRPPTWP